jgi:hypothetical protein
MVLAFVTLRTYRTVMSVYCQLTPLSKVLLEKLRSVNHSTTMLMPGLVISYLVKITSYEVSHFQLFSFLYSTKRESKGQYVASRVHTLLTGVHYQDSSNAIYSYQVRCMHVDIMAPGQRLYGCHTRAKSEILTL